MARKKQTRFEIVAKAVNQHLKEDGVVLNFKGYRETVIAYSRMADNHVGEVFDLMIDCLLWSNYMHEVRSFIEWKKEEAQLRLDYHLALEDKKNPSAQLESTIQSWKQKIREYKLLEKHLISQYKFFVKAHDQCKSAYHKGIKVLGHSA